MRQTFDKKIELNIETLTVLLKIKTKKYKNGIKKSLFVNLKCLPHQSHFERFTACSLNRSIVRFFFLFQFLCINIYFCFYYKFWSSGTLSVRNLFHFFKNVQFPRRDFAQKVKSWGGTLRLVITASTYSWNIQSVCQKKSRFSWTGAARNR